MQEARARELAREQRDAVGFGQRGVVGGDAGAREQLGDDGLVHVGVLAQVEHREMEAEDVDGAHAAARGDPRRAASRRACASDAAMRAQIGDATRPASRRAAGRRAAGAAARSRQIACAVAARRA